MTTLVKDSACLTHYFRNLHGGSQPILAQASDGHTYVVKFANNLQGPNVLFNEAAGSELYRACGLPVPEWKALWVSDEFIDETPDSWIQTEDGNLRPASGLCFGSRFLGEDGNRVDEILPRTSFQRIHNPAAFWLAWLIDVCADHVDNRQVLFTEDCEGWLDAHFIDFGHFFGGPKADIKKHFRASRHLDYRLYPTVSSKILRDCERRAKALDAGKLWERVEAIPSEWKRDSAINGLESCLQKLSIELYVQSLLSTLIGSLERRTEARPESPEDERKPEREILRRGVQPAWLGWDQVHHPLGV